MVQEYQILREILIEVLGEATDLSSGQWLAVHRSIDEAIQDAVSAFAQAQQGIRETLAATLTHDFRGPLAAASNYLRLSSASAPGEQRERHVRRAIENLKRLDRMIVDLLDVSRASAGERISLETSEFDLGALARDVIEDFGARDGEHIVLHAEGPVRVLHEYGRAQVSVHNLGEPIPADEGTTFTLDILQDVRDLEPR